VQCPNDHFYVSAYFWLEDLAAKLTTTTTAAAVIKKKKSIILK
jgi:hypothetical protein